MWDLPEPGIEPMSPALAGGFLSPGPPGKSQVRAYYDHLSFFTFSIPGFGLYLVGLEATVIYTSGQHILTEDYVSDPVLVAGDTVMDGS